MPIRYSIEKKLPIELLHDPNDIQIYTLLYRPETWLANKEVIENDIIVVPSVPNGCMYSVSQGGITGSIEPVWLTAKNSTIVSGTAKFKAIPYNLLLRTGDIIQSYVFILPDSVVIDNDSLINDSIVQFRVTSTPSTGKVNLVLRVDVLLATGLVTRYDTTITLIIQES